MGVLPGANGVYEERNPVRSCFSREGSSGVLARAEKLRCSGFEMPITVPSVRA